MKQNNKVLELLFFAVLAILFIVLFFIRKPYDIEPKPIFQTETTIESEVNNYDALSVQP